MVAGTASRRRRLDTRIVRHDDQRPGGPPRVRALERGERRRRAARERGEEYLLERRLLRRLSDGEIRRRWLEFGFPPSTTTSCARSTTSASGREPDDRVAEAVDLVDSKRDADGRWPLDRPARRAASRSGRARRATRVAGSRCVHSGSYVGRAKEAGTELERRIRMTDAIRSFPPTRPRGRTSPRSSARGERPVCQCQRYKLAPQESFRTSSPGAGLAPP